MQWRAIASTAVAPAWAAAACAAALRVFDPAVGLRAAVAARLNRALRGNPPRRWVDRSTEVSPSVSRGDSLQFPVDDPIARADQASSAKPVHSPAAVRAFRLAQWQPPMVSSSSAAEGIST